jgi:predicted methyltransferase
MAHKRYVCHFCNGKGIVMVFDPPEDLEKYSEEELPGYMKDQPCPLCVAINLQPFIEIDY